MSVRPALFICEHGKRDDEDCLHCELEYEQRQGAAWEDMARKAKERVLEIRATLEAKTKEQP